MNSEAGQAKHGNITYIYAPPTVGLSNIENEKNVIPQLNEKCKIYYKLWTFACFRPINLTIYYTIILFITFEIIL